MKKSVVLAIAFVIALSGAWSASAATAPYSPRNSTVFNNPKGSKAKQLAIVTTVNRSIDAAPKGSIIRIAQYLFNINSTTDKLIAAHKRGVQVRMLVDDGTPTKQIARVKKVLGTDKTKPSYITTCKRSCHANIASVMHAKFYLFSHAGSSRLVSMISSANIHSVNTFNSWNNIHTIVGDAKIYSSLVLYFNDMIKDKTNFNYYRTTTSGKYKLYLFPRPEQKGVNTVVISDVLNHVRCSRVAKGYGKNGRTYVRVAMWGWSDARVDIARQLWALHNRGCEVEVIYNSGRAGRRVTAALLKWSNTQGRIRVYDAWYDKNNNGYAGLYMHHKTVTINGVWFGHPATKVVYTGSQNFTGPATRANDDLILRILDNKIHDAYMSNFNYIRNRHTRKVTRVPYYPLGIASTQMLEPQINEGEM